MHQGGQEVRSQTDYILVTDNCMFHNVEVRDAQHKTDHYLVMGCLCRAAPARTRATPGSAPSYLSGLLRP